MTGTFSDLRADIERVRVWALRIGFALAFLLMLYPFLERWQYQSRVHTVAGLSELVGMPNTNPTFSQLKQLLDDLRFVYKRALKTGNSDMEQAVNKDLNVFVRHFDTLSGGFTRDQITVILSGMQGVTLETSWYKQLDKTALFLLLLEAGYLLGFFYVLPQLLGIKVVEIRTEGVNQEGSPIPIDNSKIKTSGISDRPLDEFDPQNKFLRMYTDALADFILNRETQPPITFAVTGPWGMGKSSFMNLALARLKSEGYSTCFFNAWHRQTEGDMLSALLETVRKEGASPDELGGWWIRLKLVLQRAGWAVAVLALLALWLILFPQGLGHFAAVAEQLLQPFLNGQKLGNDMLQKAFEGAGALLGLLSLGAIGLNGTTYGRFADLVRNLASLVMTVYPITKAEGNRESFERAFGELTDAMGGNLVIFVDDLDRCSPDKVVEVLESINFMTTSGKCYFVIALDPKWVMSCLSVKYSEISEKWAQISCQQGQTLAGWKDGFQFAENYLEKMINIEIPVPQMNMKQMESMMAETQGEQRVSRPAPRKRNLVKLMQAAFFAVCLGLMGGFYFLGPSMTGETSGEGVTQTQAVAANPGETGSVPAKTGAGENPVSVTNAGVSSSDRPPSLPGIPLAWKLVAGTIAAVLLAVLIVYLVIYSPPVTPKPLEDKPDAVEALTHWCQVAVLKNNTPRALIHYLNRARYLVCLMESLKKLPAHPLPANSLAAYVAFDQLHKGIIQNAEFRDLIIAGPQTGWTANEKLAGLLGLSDSKEVETVTETVSAHVLSFSKEELELFGTLNSTMGDLGTPKPVPDNKGPA